MKIMKTFKNSLLIKDLRRSLSNRHIFLTLGFQDIATRYRRSRVGAFWLTINMFVLISVLGIVFGTVFHSSVADFLPSLTIGIVVWGLISGLVSESCDSFTSVRDTILQVNLPLSTHVLRVVVRNIIIFGHNIVIIPILFLIFSDSISTLAILSIFGFIIIIFNALWMAVILSLICARFRDVTPIIGNFMQVMFYCTPIIWDGKMLPSRIGEHILNFNIFYHLLEIVRMPLLGEMPTLLNWLAPLVFGCFGWISAIYLFGRYRDRIAYWL